MATRSLKNKKKVKKIYSNYVATNDNFDPSFSVFSLYNMFYLNCIKKWVMPLQQKEVRDKVTSCYLARCD